MPGSCFSWLQTSLPGLVQSISCFSYPLCLNLYPIPTFLLRNATFFFVSAFFSQLHSNVLLLPSASSTLCSVFPSPYINPSEGEVSQAPDKKNIPPNKDLWNGNLANPSEWVCLRVRGWRRFHPGHSLTLSIHSLLLTTAPHTAEHKLSWGMVVFSFNGTLSEIVTCHAFKTGHSVTPNQCPGFQGEVLMSN